MTATNAGSSAHERQRISRIRLATERMPCVWLWNVTIQLGGGLPMGSSQDLKHGQGGVQGGVGSPEGQDHAGAVGGEPIPLGAGNGGVAKKFQRIHRPWPESEKPPVVRISTKLMVCELLMGVVAHARFQRHTSPYATAA